MMSRSATNSMTGTPQPHESEMRSTSTTITARAPTWSGMLARDPLEHVVAGQRHATAPVQAHDPRAAVEGAEHQADAAVLGQVRDRLGAAAGQIEPGHGVRVEDAERVESAWRDVDVPLCRQRRGRHEEEVLLADPRRETVVDLVENLAHAASLREGPPRPRPCTGALPAGRRLEG